MQLLRGNRKTDGTDRGTRKPTFCRRYRKSRRTRSFTAPTPTTRNASFTAPTAPMQPSFWVWKGPGKAFYKVANNVLSPRYFKDSGDIGTITVRYVVESDGRERLRSYRLMPSLWMPATSRHPSLGNVERAEYAAIQEHLKTIQAQRQDAEENSAKHRRLSAAAAPRRPPEVRISRMTGIREGRLRPIPPSQRARHCRSASMPCDTRWSCASKIRERN